MSELKTHHFAHLYNTSASILVTANSLGDGGWGLDLQLLLNLKQAPTAHVEAFRTLHK